MLNPSLMKGARSMLSQAGSILGNRGHEAAIGAGIGALGGASMHASTGLLGALGSPTGMTQSNFSLGGMLGAGIRGGVVGGALAASAGSKTFGSGVSMAAKSLGALAPKSSSKLGSNMMSASMSSPMANLSGMTIGASLRAGASGAQGMSLMNRGRQAMSIFSGGSNFNKAVAGASLGGIGFAAYSGNAMGMSVPGNYGYR